MQKSIVHGTRECCKRMWLKKLKGFPHGYRKSGSNLNFMMAGRQRQPFSVADFRSFNFSVQAAFHGLLDQVLKGRKQADPLYLLATSRPLGLCTAGQLNSGFAGV